ncbi:MAG: hypothetical protein QJR02_01540 [Sinobacteraceae bacterium]|nr:hypothetical protein [Nevskiaceae bacterium]
MGDVRNKTAAGWSVDRRRAEIHRLLGLMIESGLSDREAKERLARRFTIGLNTVEGWLSEGGNGSRPPPDWKTLDILRYELGVVAVRKLL